MTYRDKFTPGIWLISFLGIHSANGTEWGTLDDYLKDMNTLGKPSVLIVGCGHSEGGLGNHFHPNCWCVDIPRHNYPWLLPWWQEIKANDEFDITTSSIAKTKQHYHEKFETVLLENLWEEVFNQPIVLWNSAYVLKENGELIIETQPYYKFSFYDNTSIDSDSPEENEFEKNKDILKKYGINDIGTYQISNELKAMGDYLRYYHFKDVITIKDAYQPYTAIPSRGIHTARRGCVLSARKTSQTQSILNDWHNDIFKTEPPLLP